MAVPQMISQPEALLLYSGSRDAFDAHRPSLDTLGSSRFLGADGATAALYDLALLGGMYGMLAGFFHSFALVGTKQVTATEFTSLLVHGSTRWSACRPVAQEIDTGDYRTDADGLQASRDALANILQARTDQGIEIDLLAPLQVHLDQRVADGRGADSLSSVIEVLRAAPG